MMGDETEGGLGLGADWRLVRYYNEHWPLLAATTAQILGQLPYQPHLLALDEAYRVVYALCLQGQQQRLWGDLEQICTAYLKDVAREVRRVAPAGERFAAAERAADAYAKSVDALVAVYRFLHRDVAVRQLLFKLFGTVVLVPDGVLDEVLARLASYQYREWLYKPAQDRQSLTALLHTVYETDPSMSRCNASLFRTLVLECTPLSATGGRLDDAGADSNAVTPPGSPEKRARPLDSSPHSEHSPCRKRRLGGGPASSPTMWT